MPPSRSPQRSSLNSLDSWLAFVSTVTRSGAPSAPSSTRVRWSKPGLFDRQKSPLSAGPASADRTNCRIGNSRYRFRIDMPRYIEFYLQGHLNLDDMISKRMKLEDVNEAFRAMKAGEVARSVLMFD
jgi:hypothetical protein